MARLIAFTIIAALAERPHCRLQPFRDGPDPRRGFGGQPVPFERLQASETQRAVKVGADLARLGTQVEHLVLRLLDHGAVDPGEAVGGDLRTKLLAQLQVALGPQFQGRALLSPKPPRSVM